MREIKNNKVYSRIRVIKYFFQIMGVRLIHIIFPITLSFIAAAFDGVGLGLLIPLAKGIVSNFSFVKEIPILKHLIVSHPALFDKLLISNKSTFLFLAILVFFCVCLKNIIVYLSNVFSCYWHGRYKRNVYRFIFNRFLSFGKLFFDRTNQGYLTLVMAYSEYVMSVLNLFENAINVFFTLTVYFIIMAIISFKLTLVTILIFPLLHYALKLLITKLQYAAELKNEVLITLNIKVFNILSGIPLVKAYSREDEIKKNYADINEKVRKLEFSSDRIQRLTSPIQDIIITAVLLLMVSIVALLLAKDKPTEISVFVIFFYAARRALPMFNIFNEIKVSFAMAKPPIKEIFKILDDKDKFFVIGSDKVFKGLQEKIEFANLNFSYIKEIQVLKNINFSVEEGKITAIVGPTGAGKTTLISLLMRFYDCPPSSILIDGADIRDFTLKSLRAHMALVSQEVFLFNDTLRNNIIFGLDKEVTAQMLEGVARKARIYDFAMRLPDKFDTEIGDRGVKLSGGEKQRVAVARALLKNSEVFILDEATSSLDTETERLIQEAINEAVKDRTAIVIAHRLSTIKNADKIVVIEDGRFIEEGPLNELLDQKGKFYEYWEAQKFY